MQQYVLKIRITKQSLDDTVSYFNILRNAMFDINKYYLKVQFDNIFKMTHNTTMVATGELRSRLFRTYKFLPSFAFFEVGYGPTSNNQSIKQEFEKGGVHRTAFQHYRGKSQACSVEPVNLYKQRGTYMGNVHARRKALGLSIESVLGTKVYPIQSSGGYSYIPDYSTMLRRLIYQDRRIIKHLKGL